MFYCFLVVWFFVCLLFFFIYVDHSYLLANEIIILKKKKVKYLSANLSLQNMYFFSIVVDISCCDGSGTAFPTITQMPIKDWKIQVWQGKKPHWNGQITEITERIFSLLLPFVFWSFPQLLLRWGDHWWMRERRKVLLGDFSAARCCWGVSICHPWSPKPHRRLMAGSPEPKGMTIMQWMERKRAVTGTSSSEKLSVCRGCCTGSAARPRDAQKDPWLWTQASTTSGI